MDRDDGALEWDAAFEALVAQLRPPRYLRVARLAAQVALAVALLGLACWTVIHLVCEPMSQLGRPWL